MTLNIAFTANAGGIAVDDKQFGPPAELVRNADFQRQHPLVWVAAQAYLANGTTSGTVTVTAT